MNYKIYKFFLLPNINQLDSLPKQYIVILIIVNYRYKKYNWWLKFYRSYKMNYIIYTFSLDLNISLRGKIIISYDICYFRKRIQLYNRYSYHMNLNRPNNRPYIFNIKSLGFDKSLRDKINISIKMDHYKLNMKHYKVYKFNFNL